MMKESNVHKMHAVVVRDRVKEALRWGGEIAVQTRGLILGGPCTFL
jgi:hypothetical protein